MSTYNYSTVLSDKSQKIINQLVAADGISYEQLRRIDEASLNANCYMLRDIANRFFIDNSIFKQDVSNVIDVRVSSLIDNHTITLRKYTPKQPQKLGQRVILFIHGGGWIQGNVDTHDNLCRKMSNAFSLEVVSVNYRLSPEYRFPIPLYDALSAYMWCVNEHYEEIILSGDSVGGNLCAALCIELRNTKVREFRCNRPPIAQILFYPVLSSDLNSESFKLFKNGYGLTTEWTKYYIYQYTGADYNDRKYINNELLYPLLGNPRDFPRTFLVSAECDVLLDGQLNFFKKLKEAGVDADQTILSGSIHGFVTYDKYFNDDIDTLLAELGKKILDHI